MEIILLIILLIITLFLITLLLLLFYLLYYEIFKANAPFVATSIKKHNQQFDKLFDFLAKLNLKNEKVIDLGSGNGDMVLEFANRGYQSYGVELNPILIFWSKWRARKFPNAYFIKDNLFKFDLSQFKIVYIYQLESVNQKLMPKFEKELQKDAVIISHKFILPESEKIKLIHKIDEVILIYKKI
jgi:SAM-dependent methyltransferase